MKLSTIFLAASSSGGALVRSVRRTRIITGCTILAALAFVSIHGISRAGVLLSGPYSPGSQRNPLRAAHGDDERTLVRANDTLGRKGSLATGGPRRERSVAVYTPLPPPLESNGLISFGACCGIGHRLARNL